MIENIRLGIPLVRGRSSVQSTPAAPNKSLKYRLFKLREIQRSATIGRTDGDGRKASGVYDSGGPSIFKALPQLPAISRVSKYATHKIMPGLRIASL